jgi:DNA-binding NtrC family response regulator
VIEHLAVLAAPGQPIGPEDIPFYETPAKDATEKTIPTALLDEGYYSAREKLVSNFEKAYLWRVVDKAGGNMSKAARMASIDRTTLYRLIERYNFTREEFADAPASVDK